MCVEVVVLAYEQQAVTIVIGRWVGCTSGLSRDLVSMWKALGGRDGSIGICQNDCDVVGWDLL